MSISNRNHRRNFLKAAGSFVALCATASVSDTSRSVTAADLAELGNNGSNLPLLVIDTGGKPIPNEPKIDAKLLVIDHGGKSPNHPTDKPTLETSIRIEVRGSSSQMFDKKSYRLETVDDSDRDRAVPLLGLPKDSDWILYASYSDKSFLRNVLAYELSNKMGRYAPRTRYAEVILGDAALPPEKQYAGIYVLMENIKRSKQRVDIPRLQTDESGKVSGGYIVKIDRVGGPETYFTSELGSVVGFVSPRGDRLDDAQRAWIRQDFSRIERTLASRDFRDPEKGYAAHFDVDSFIDYFLINELFKNVDAYFLSTFLHRDGAGKLHLGPVWDLDLSSGNASYGGAWHTEGWMLFPNDPRRAGGAPFWWDRLFEDPQFRARLAARWRAFRATTLSEASIVESLDEHAKQLNEAQQRNFERWPILGTYVWPNPRPFPRTYDGEVTKLKNWLSKRLVWIDQNIDRVGPAVESK